MSATVVNVRFEPATEPEPVPVLAGVDRGDDCWRYYFQQGLDAGFSHEEATNYANLMSR